MPIVWLQFFTGALLVIVAGTKLTKSADVLERALELGTGWAGVLLLAPITSLPELVVSLRAAIICLYSYNRTCLSLSKIYRVAQS